MAGRSDHFMLDPARGRTYTPPTRVFDDSSGQWIFDVDGQMELLEEQLRLALEDYEAQRRDGRPGG